MTEIVIPIIATWMKFIVTPVLGFVAIFSMVWGAGSFSGACRFCGESRRFLRKPRAKARSEDWCCI